MPIVQKPQKAQVNNKGGRPKKFIKKDEFIGVRCNKIEKTIIIHKAKKLTLTPSEYLRALGLDRQIDIQTKALPKEVLLFTATLNHLAANINQVAKKRNKEETFNAIERAEWNLLAEEVKILAVQIK